VSETVYVGPLELRPAECGVLVDGRWAYVTKREFQVLWALVQEPGVVVPREALYERVWSLRMRHRDRSVDTHVRKVRLKLEAAAPGWEFIHTHFGIGYRFAPEPKLPMAAIEAPVGPARAGTRASRFQRPRPPRERSGARKTAA
jgi:DNA-binding response OmpR family regulator